MSKTYALKQTSCLDPATGNSIAEIPLNTVEDIHQAVTNAQTVQPEWQSLPIKKRIRHVKKIVQYILKHADEIAETISKDNGKTLADAMLTEVVTTAMAANYYCKKARPFLKDRPLSMGNILFINKRSHITRVPYGVIGIISPWNYPFAIPFSEVIMALLAGNTVILKTASETQLVGDTLRKVIESADLPPHVFTYINIPGKIAGDAFIDAGVDKLLFTGSVSVGKYLMKKASETLTPIVLELGGNDPMIVCEDADLYRAATGAIWAGMQNAGQSCGGVERVYVHHDVYHEFLSILKEKVEALRIGPGCLFSSDIGAMTTQRQIDIVEMHIKDALEKGATIFARANPPELPKGQFTSCVVLTDVNHDMLVMKDETFGPVLGVMPYKTIDEAIELANDSYLGLTGSVWSKNRSKAKKIARRIKSGAVLINDHLMSHGLAETPWGGFKQSGIGRTHGDIGFAEMTQPQVIVNELLPFARRNFFWHPFDENLYEALKGVIQVLYSKNIVRKLVSLLKLALVFIPRTFRKV